MFNLDLFKDYVPNTHKEMRVEAAQGTRFLVIGTAKVGPPVNVLYMPDLKLNVEVWYKSGIIFDRNKMKQCLKIPPMYALYIRICVCIRLTSAARTIYISQCNNTMGLRSMLVRVFNSIVNGQSCNSANS